LYILKNALLIFEQIADLQTHKVHNSSAWTCGIELNQSCHHEA